MKDFFESIKKGAYVGTKVIMDTTKNVIDTSKREIDIQKIKYDINKELKQIGMLKYEEKIGQIKDASVEINKLLDSVESKMKMLETLKTTPENTSPENTAQPNEEDEPSDNEHKVIIKPEKNEEGYFIMRFCNYCNIGNHPEATHCVNCGRKLS